VDCELKTVGLSLKPESNKQGHQGQQKLIAEMLENIPLRWPYCSAIKQNTPVA
jgi:hypothetical protein